MFAILKLGKYGALISCTGLGGLTALVNRAKLIQLCLEGKNITHPRALSRVRTQHDPNRSDE